MRLTPIENPPSLLVRLAYWLTRRQFGKVITPLKVIYARSPALMFASRKLQATENRLILPKPTRHLIKSFVSHLNQCSFCMNLQQYMAARENPETRELTELMNFRESSRFSPREKALLAYLEEVTATKTASDAVFADLKAHFSEREIVEITWLCAVENYYNLLARPLGIGSDELA